jgi:transglutaminase-like putative cysteine protease
MAVHFKSILLAWAVGMVLASRDVGADLVPPEAKPSVGPPAKWVVPHFFDQTEAEKPAQSGEDERVRLLERQLNPAENESFTHLVRELLTYSGVQNGATISIDFDPSYESLTFHWLRIWRDHEHLERLDPDQIKIIQPERDLSQAQLNGRKSAVIVLEDVRVGDVIDYAYSRKGMNPVFGGRFTGTVQVQLSEPADRLITRVLWPRQRRLRAQAHGCLVVPTAVRRPDYLEYTWAMADVPALRPEDSLPDWYQPEPWVQLSEYQTWSEVAQWATSLFQNTAPLAPALKQKIAEWQGLPDHEEQVLAALRFLQDEVRYFGIEMGTSSHRPADPSLVFARRYGDCKDKALLFVTMLRALGVEADPVLVNTTARGTIDQWLPSATAFDHVIVLVQFDGQAWWLDPTAGYQRGPLAAHYLTGYGMGLVVAPGTTGLSAIPQSAGRPSTTTTEYFRLRGTTEPADLRVVTVSEGGDADAVRALFATTPREVVAKSYLQPYADLYPGLRSAGPPAMEDDEQQNRVATTEYYTLAHGWTDVGKSGKYEKYKCEFYAGAMAGLLKNPVDTDRQMPLGITYPEHQVVRMEVVLPEAWPGEAIDKTVDDAAFFFRMRCRCSGSKLVLEYEYNSLADAVPAARMPEYLAHVAEASKLLGYTLTWR